MNNEIDLIPLDFRAMPSIKYATPSPWSLLQLPTEPYLWLVLCIVNYKNEIEYCTDREVYYILENGEGLR